MILMSYPMLNYANIHVCFNLVVKTSIICTFHYIANAMVDVVTIEDEPKTKVLYRNSPVVPVYPAGPKSLSIGVVTHEPLCSHPCEYFLLCIVITSVFLMTVAVSHQQVLHLPPFHPLCKKGKFGTTLLHFLM